MNDTQITTLTQNLTSVFLPAMTANAVNQQGFDIKVRDVSSDNIITTTININRDIAPLDGFAPTQAEIVFEVDFYCDYNEEKNTYTWDGEIHCLNYGHYSHNLLWANGSIKDGPVPFDSGNAHGITDANDKIVCIEVIDSLFGLTDADALKGFLQAVFEVANKKALEEWCIIEKI